MKQEKDSKAAPDKLLSKQKEIEKSIRDKVEKRKVQETVDKTIMDWKDPHAKEFERRQKAAEKEYTAEARKDLGHSLGQTEHEHWTAERREQESNKGRVEGRDFGVNVTMFHPDGKPVYLDYVDYKTDTIVDRKPIAQGESEAALKNRYAEQRSRHIEAYEHTTGRQVFAYEYSEYPSSRDIYRD